MELDISSIHQTAINTKKFARPGRILIADDNHNFRVLLVHVLQTQGHEVISVGTGKEVLLALAQEVPDLIILDVKLPDMNGIDLCQKIKLEPRMQHVPIMLISGIRDERLLHNFLECGASDFLEKPLDNTVVLARVRTMLKYRRVLEALQRAQRRLTMRVENQAQDLARVNHELEDRVEDLEALQESTRRINNQLDQLITSIPSILIGLDGADRITHWNAQAEVSFGMSADSVMGRSLAECPIPWDLRTVQRGLQQCKESGEPIRVAKTSFSRPDSTEGVLGLNISPIRDRSRGTTGTLIFGADITERINLEQQFHQSQKMEAMGSLAGGVAHDFNNMLMIIIGQCELMRSKNMDEISREKKLEEVLSCAQKAARLTSQLLTFSRNQIQKREVLAINDVVEEANRMLRRLVGEHIEFCFEPGPNAGYVHADANQIMQVLMNLTVNARDAMEKGGKLTITTARVHLEPKGNLPGGEHVELAVRDTGHGMDAETRVRIFEPFFTTKEKGKGTGLGLATVYGIVQQNDGRIAVDSKPGAGTTFRVCFPRVELDVDEDERKEEAKPAEAPQGSETILIVEDEPAIRELVSEMLEGSGYDVRVAENCEQAISLCDNDVALLISDLVMPDMSGLDLCGHLLEKTPSLKVIFMSGYSEAQILPSYQSVYKPHFVQKPFSVDLLLRKVREVIDQEADDAQRMG